MPQRCVTHRRKFILQRYSPLFFFYSGLLCSVPFAHAQTAIGPVTVGAGLRTSYDHTEPDGAPGTDKFQVDNVRIYINGDVTDQIKFMFNTDYDSATNKLGVLDAVARIEISPHFNIWAGRFLPPSDRANLYGPFFAHNWAVYQDGVQDGYPFVFQGRDNGVTYWGDFAKRRVKVSLGAFDGGSATNNSTVIGAARVQVDFWDIEEGYYLNGTYYGDKNLLAIGGATQFQSGRTATTADFLLEKKLRNMGVINIEAEYSNYNRLGGYDASYGKSQGAYGLASYLFPKQVGIGKFEVLGKYAKADFTHGIKALNPAYNQKTAEGNFSYVMKQFKARLTAFYTNTRFNAVKNDFWTAGLGLQVQI
ncbi:MAG: hypothetical protein JO323_05125 [Acidobacteriia bacterium]|nr:hypothetical protein [Terriglobia bacterium]